MMRSIVLSFLLIVMFNSGNVESINIHQVQDEYVDGGATLHLTCSVNGASSGTNLNWVRTPKKEGGVPKQITYNSEILPNEYRDRYSIRNDGVSSRQYVLMIRDAQLEDAGLWTCTAYPDFGDSVSMSLTVTVFSPPKITAISPTPGALPLNTNYTLFCNATGSPEPTIKWRRVNPQYLPNYRPFSIGRLFNLTKMTSNHRGLYECIASNGRGDSARGSVKINFSYGPIVKAIREDILLPKNLAGNISCSFEGFPKVTRISDVYWYKGSTRLVSTDTQNYLMDVEEYDRDSDRTVGILTIRNVTSNKGGEYKCRYRNGAERSISVTVGAVADRKAGRVPSGATAVGPTTAIGLTIIMALIVAYFQ